MPSAARRHCVLAVAAPLALLAAGALPASAKTGSPGWHRVQPRKAESKPSRSSWHLVRRNRPAKKQGAAKTPTRYADRVGFASHTSYMSETEGHALLGRATAIGVTWVREDFPWSVIERRG